MRSASFRERARPHSPLNVFTMVAEVEAWRGTSRRSKGTRRKFTPSPDSQARRLPDRSVRGLSVTTACTDFCSSVDAAPAAFLPNPLPPSFGLKGAGKPHRIWHRGEPCPFGHYNNSFSNLLLSPLFLLSLVQPLKTQFSLSRFPAALSFADAHDASGLPSVMGSAFLCVCIVSSFFLSICPEISSPQVRKGFQRPIPRLIIPSQLPPQIGGRWKQNLPSNRQSVAPRLNLYLPIHRRSSMTNRPMFLQVYLRTLDHPLPKMYPRFPRSQSLRGPLVRHSQRLPRAHFHRS